jgi:hypothetical protein
MTSEQVYEKRRQSANRRGKLNDSDSEDNITYEAYEVRVGSRQSTPSHRQLITGPDSVRNVFSFFFFF